MPISYDEFLTVADDSVLKSGEVWVRNAVSRSYYAMYHSAIRLTNGKIPSTDEHGNKLKGGTHERFSEYLCSGQASADFDIDPVKTKEIGLALKTAHAKRCNSDYKLSRKINKIEAISNIQEAREVDILVTSLLDDQKRVG